VFPAGVAVVAAVVLVVAVAMGFAVVELQALRCLLLQEVGMLPLLLLLLLLLLDEDKDFRTATTLSLSMSWMVEVVGED